MSKAFKLIVINRPPCLPSYVMPPSLPPPTQTDQPSDAVKKPVSDSLFPHCLLPPILPPAPFSASSISQGGQVTSLKQASICPCYHLTSGPLLCLLHLSRWASHQPQTSQYLILCYRLISWVQDSNHWAIPTPRYTENIVKLQTGTQTNSNSNIMPADLIVRTL